MKVYKYLNTSNSDVLKNIKICMESIYKTSDLHDIDLILEFLSLSEKNNRYYELFGTIIENLDECDSTSFIFCLDLSDYYILDRVTLEVNKNCNTNFEKTECYDFLTKWISKSNVDKFHLKYNLKNLDYYNFRNFGDVEKYLENNNIQDLFNLIENRRDKYSKIINITREDLNNSKYGFVLHDLSDKYSVTDILYYGDYDLLFLDEIIDEDIFGISELINIEIPEYYKKILKSVLNKDRYLEINNYVFDTYSLAYRNMAFDTFLVVTNTEKVYNFYNELSIFLEERIGSFYKICTSSRELYISLNQEKIIHQIPRIQIYYDNKEYFLEGFKFCCPEMTLILKNYYLNNIKTSITFFRKFNENELKNIVEFNELHPLQNIGEYIDCSDIEYCDLYIVNVNPFDEMFIKYFSEL